MRRQKFIENREVLKIAVVVSGVPQGSVLGQILFMVIIDSKVDLGISSNIGMFANDTRVMKQIMNESDWMKL